MDRYRYYFVTHVDFVRERESQQIERKTRLWRCQYEIRFFKFNRTGVKF
jgi:hypothetical protein